MKKKKRRSISLSARAAIALILLSLFTLSGWRDVAIYFGAKSGNTETVTAECIAVQSSRTDELRQHTPYRMLYVLTLQDGTKVAVSSDEAKSPFSSLEEPTAFCHRKADHMHLRPKTGVFQRRICPSFRNLRRGRTLSGIGRYCALQGPYRDMFDVRFYSLGSRIAAPYRPAASRRHTEAKKQAQKGTAKAGTKREAAFREWTIGPLQRQAQVFCSTNSVA